MKIKPEVLEAIEQKCLKTLLDEETQPTFGEASRLLEICSRIAGIEKPPEAGSFSGASDLIDRIYGPKKRREKPKPAAPPSVNETSSGPGL